MKNRFAAIAIAIALFMALVVGASLRVLAWKHYIDKRAFYAEVSGAYLFGPSGVVDAQGRPLTRQQLLDAYLHELVEAHPETGLRFAKAH